MENEPKKCPKCRFLNPPSAQRCDCGYDFEKGTIEKPYFKQELPNDIKTYFYVAVFLNLSGLIVVLADPDIMRIVGIVLWSVAFYYLYSQLVKRKNWARIGLIIITFPWDLLLSLSHEARLYCLQKKA